MSDLALGVVGGLGILVGLVGTLVPVLPGLVVVLVAAATTLLLQGGGPFAWTVVVLLGALTLVGTLLSTVLPARRAVSFPLYARFSQTIQLQYSIYDFWKESC